MVFIVKATAVYLKLCFDVGLPGVEVDLAVFIASESIRVVELCSVLWVEGVESKGCC